MYIIIKNNSTWINDIPAFEQAVVRAFDIKESEYDSDGISNKCFARYVAHADNILLSQGNGSAPSDGDNLNSAYWYDLSGNNRTLMGYGQTFTYRVSGGPNGLPSIEGSGGNNNFRTLSTSNVWNYDEIIIMGVWKFDTSFTGFQSITSFGNSVNSSKSWELFGGSADENQFINVIKDNHSTTYITNWPDIPTSYDNFMTVWDVPNGIAECWTQNTRISKGTIPSGMTGINEYTGQMYVGGRPSSVHLDGHLVEVCIMNKYTKRHKILTDYYIDTYGPF